MNLSTTRRAVTVIGVAAAAICTLVQRGSAQQSQQTFEVVPVHRNVYMVAGVGGNVTVQIGDDGVLVVDTGAQGVSDKLLAAITQLTAKPIRWIIDTNVDPDHTGGNEAVSKAGRSIPQIAVGTGKLFEGQDAVATVVAHENVLNRMSAPVGRQAPTPTAAWPAITYFGDEKEMYFNDEPIQIFHIPAAHTDGDSIVVFRHSDVVSAGDTFVMTRYPLIDMKTGGTINGIIAALNRIIDITVPREKQEGGTYVIPGHGRVCDESDVVAYRDMVTIIRDRVQDMMKRGMTVDQVKARKPTFDYDGRWATSAWTADMFVEAVYRTLPSTPAGNAGRGPTPAPGQKPQTRDGRR